MATSAVAPKSRVSKKTGSKPGSPQRWWQWIFLYPSFAVALITAGPQWVDKAKAYGLGVRSAADAQRQALLWQKNASCVGLNSSGYVSPSRIAVDATICKSGDILVRAITPQKAEIYKWLPLDDVVTKAKKGGGGLISAAEAATLSARFGPFAPPAAAPVYKVAWLQMVVCAKSDGRYLRRIVQTSNGCFLEVIDTFTGALVSRNPVPCAPQC